MKTTVKKLMGLVLAACLLTTTAAWAQDKNLDIKLTVQKVAVAADGKETLEAGDKAKPGETLQYTAVYKNLTKGSLKGLQANLPIPAGMEYLPDSAAPKAGVLATVDGVKYAAVPLKRKVKASDGKEIEELVPYTQYRGLRWTIGELPAEKSVTVSARTKVAGAAQK